MAGDPSAPAHLGGHGSHVGPMTPPVNGEAWSCSSLPPGCHPTATRLRRGRLHGSPEASLMPLPPLLPIALSSSAITLSFFPRGHLAMVTRVPALGMLSLAFPSQATFAFLKPASWLGLLPRPPLPLHNPTPSRFSDRPRRPAPPPPDPPSPPRPPLSHRTPCHFQQRAMLKRACAFIYTLLLLPPPLKCSRGKRSTAASPALTRAGACALLSEGRTLPPTAAASSSHHPHCQTLKLVPTYILVLIRKERNEEGRRSDVGTERAVARLTPAAPSQEPRTGGCAEKGLSASPPDTAPHLPPELPCSRLQAQQARRLRN